MNGAEEVVCVCVVVDLLWGGGQLNKVLVGEGEKVCWISCRGTSSTNISGGEGGGAENDALDLL